MAIARAQMADEEKPAKPGATDHKLAGKCEGLYRRAANGDAPRHLAQPEAGARYHDGGDRCRVRVRGVLRGRGLGREQRGHQAVQRSHAIRQWQTKIFIPKTATPINDTPEAAAEPAEPVSELAVRGSPSSRKIPPRTGTSSTPIPASSRKWRIRCAAASQAFGFADQIGQILIPTEEVVELRNGKKVTSKRLLYPGYVLVQMEMNDSSGTR